MVSPTQQSDLAVIVITASPFGYLAAAGDGLTLAFGWAVTVTTGRTVAAGVADAWLERVETRWETPEPAAASTATARTRPAPPPPAPAGGAAAAARGS